MPHRLSVKSFLKVPQTLLLVLLLPENPVLPQDLLLLVDLHELHDDAPLLLGLPGQTGNQLLVTDRLLQEVRSYGFQSSSSYEMGLDGIAEP